MTARCSRQNPAVGGKRGFSVNVNPNDLPGTTDAVAALSVGLPVKTRRYIHKYAGRWTEPFDVPGHPLCSFARYLHAVLLGSFVTCFSLVVSMVAPIKPFLHNAATTPEASSIPAHFSNPPGFILLAGSGQNIINDGHDQRRLALAPHGAYRACSPLSGPVYFGGREFLGPTNATIGTSTQQSLTACA